jgi:hypothetical protein
MYQRRGASGEAEQDEPALPFRQIDRLGVEAPPERGVETQETTT